jgi:ketosteroid isomerase-like protein
MTHQLSVRRLHCLVIALGVILVAGAAFAQMAGPRAGTRAAIEAANARFSVDYAKGDATAVASHYSAAAWAFPPNGDIVRGREAIGKLWKSVMDSGVKGVKLTTVEVEAHGPTAHEVGTYILTGEGGKTLDTGKYVVVWKREGMQWRIHRDIWNTSAPAPK